MAPETKGNMMHLLDNSTVYMTTLFWTNLYLDQKSIQYCWPNFILPLASVCLLYYIIAKFPVISTFKPIAR